MKRVLFNTLWISLGLLTIVVASGFYLIQREFARLESTDPKIWLSDIEAFEREDKERQAPSQAVLFVGSSSIRFWFSLEQDMYPIPVIRRGFGGAKLADITYYADRIIFPYTPSTIVLFAGSNDIRGAATDKTPLQLLHEFKKLTSLIHKNLPGTHIYFIAITPTIGRWQVWPQVQLANQLIETYATSQSYLHFIDTTSFLLTREGLPNEDLLWWDGVHLNKAGYRLWGNTIKRRLLQDLHSPTNHQMDHARMESLTN